MGTYVRRCVILALAGMCLAMAMATAGCGGGTTEPPVFHGTVSGTITGPSGTPLGGATVQLNSATVSPVTTANDGSYRFASVRSGSYKVTATYTSGTLGLLSAASATFALDVAHPSKLVNLQLTSTGPPPPPI
jgi:hypothetical protein